MTPASLILWLRWLTMLSDAINSSTYLSSISWILSANFYHVSTVLQCDYWLINWTAADWDISTSAGKISRLYNRLISMVCDRFYPRTKVDWRYHLSVISIMVPSHNVLSTPPVHSSQLMWLPPLSSVPSRPIHLYTLYTAAAWPISQ